MSRDFTKSTANYMSLGTNALSPLLSGATTICGHAWVWVDTFDTGATDNKILTIIHDGANEGLSLLLSGASPVLKVQGRSETGETLRSLSGATPVPTGQWVSVGFRCDFANDVTNAVFLNGSSDNDGAMSWDTTAYTPGVPTLNDRIGSHPGGVVTQWFDGRIAEVVLWAGDISDAGFAALAKGWHPPEVARPLCYFPLLGDESSLGMIRDNFTDTNGVSLDAHVMDVGSGWVEYAGTWQVSNNKAEMTTVGGGRVAADSGKTDVTITAEVHIGQAGSTLAPGLVGRLADANNFWAVILNQSDLQLQLWEVTGGSGSLRDSAGYYYLPNTTYQLELVLDGTAISATDGNVSVSYSSAAHQSNTKHGLQNNQGSPITNRNTWDNFTAARPGFRDEYGNQTATITGTIAKAVHPPKRAGIWVPQWFGNSLTIVESVPSGDFDPYDWGTPIWWMDAAQGVEQADGVPSTDGQNVRNWLDSTVTGMDFQQTVASWKPYFYTGVVNGYPVVRFDGSDDFMEPFNSNRLGAFTELTAFVVFKTDSNSIWQGLLGYTDAVGGRTFRVDIANSGIGNTVACLIYASGNVWLDASSVDLSDWLMITFTIQQSGTGRLWISNVLQDTEAIGTLQYTGTGDLAIGKVVGNKFDGDLAEIIYYNAVLSDANRIAATAALMAKYGIT